MEKSSYMELEMDTDDGCDDDRYEGNKGNILTSWN